MRNFLNELRGPQFFVLLMVLGVLFFALYGNDSSANSNDDVDIELARVLEKIKNDDPQNKKVMEVEDWSKYVDDFTAKGVDQDPIAEKIRERVRIKRKYGGQ